MVVSKEKKHKNLAVLTKTGYWNFFVSKASEQQRWNSVAFIIAPENVGENHDISFEASFTLRLAGHVDMLFLRCFCL